MLGEVDEAFIWLERAYGWANAELLFRLKVLRHSIAFVMTVVIVTCCDACASTPDR
jgi:hypothetical protein